MDEVKLSREEELWSQMRRCGHFLWTRAGGKASQNRILSILGRHEGITQKELLEMTDIQSGSLSEILGKIEAEGLIVRSRNPQDKRNTDIRLTQTGRRRAEEIDAHWEQDLKELFAPLTPQELDALLDMLRRLLASWEVKMDET